MYIIVKNKRRLRTAKVLLNLSASAIALAPSTPISLLPKIMTKCINNRFLISIIKKNRNLVRILKIIIQINIKTK